MKEATEKGSAGKSKPEERKRAPQRSRRRPAEGAPPGKALQGAGAPRQTDTAQSPAQDRAEKNEQAGVTRPAPPVSAQERLPAERPAAEPVDRPSRETTTEPRVAAGTERKSRAETAAGDTRKSEPKGETERKPKPKSGAGDSDAPTAAEEKARQDRAAGES